MAEVTREEMVAAVQYAKREMVALLEAGADVLDILRGLNATLRELEAGGWRIDWRHKKRGTLYQEIGCAELQAGEPVQEGAVLMVYQAAGGKLWARPEAEFHDGRFEKFPSPTTSDGGGENDR